MDFLTWPLMEYPLAMMTFTAGLIRSNSWRHLWPPHARHPKVHDDQVNFVRLMGITFQRLLSRGGCQDLVPECPSVLAGRNPG